jgi:hypothetical protein
LPIVLAFSGLTLLGAWLGLSGGLYLLWPWLPVAPDLTGLERLAASTLTAILLVGASPAVTIAVIAEGDREGPSRIWRPKSSSRWRSRSSPSSRCHRESRATVFGSEVLPALIFVVAAAWSLVGAVAFGAAAGAVFMAYVNYVGREITVVLLVLCTLLTGIAAPWDSIRFLAGLAAGLVIQKHST